MYSDFAKREKMPQDILLEQALKEVKDIPQAQEEWWDNNNPEVISTLVEAGYDVNVRNNDGKTLLILAAIFNDNSEVVRVLLECGANVNIKDNNGKTALDYAKENESQKILKLLEEYSKK